MLGKGNKVKDMMESDTFVSMAFCMVMSFRTMLIYHILLINTIKLIFNLFKINEQLKLNMISFSLLVLVWRDLY